MKRIIFVLALMAPVIGNADSDVPDCPQVGEFAEQIYAAINEVGSDPLVVHEKLQENLGADFDMYLFDLMIRSAVAKKVDKPTFKKLWIQTCEDLVRKHHAES